MNTFDLVLYYNFSVSVNIQTYTVMIETLRLDWKLNSYGVKLNLAKVTLLSHVNLFYKNKIRSIEVTNWPSNARVISPVFFKQF